MPIPAGPHPEVVRLRRELDDARGKVEALRGALQGLLDAGGHITRATIQGLVDKTG